VLAFSEKTVRVPKGERDPARIRAGHLAAYHCEHCERPIPDDSTHKRGMLARGVWVPDGCEIDAAGAISGEPKGRDPTHRGYHVNALYSPWLSWSDVAAEFFASKDDIGKLLNFTNSWLGWIWEEQTEATDPQKVAALAMPELEPGRVPDDALVLTAGADVQKDFVYYVVRAWGYGERSWLVEAGRVERLETLAHVLWVEPRARRGGDPVPVQLLCIDSGYRTDEIYEFALRHQPQARATKGQQSIAGIPIRASRIQRDATGDASRWSIRLWNVDTTYFKDKLLRLMSLASPDECRWHLHQEPSEEYLRHVTSEHKVLVRNRKTGAAKEEWTPKPGGGANHWLDCEVYALAAAEMLEVYAMRPEEGDEAAARGPDGRDEIDRYRDERDAQRTYLGARRGSWIGGRRRGEGSWLRR
jgi:phage terminase large subunit GpA-like protein